MQTSNATMGESETAGRNAVQLLPLIHVLFLTIFPKHVSAGGHLGGAMLWSQLKLERLVARSYSTLRFGI